MSVLRGHLASRCPCPSSFLLLPRRLTYLLTSSSSLSYSQLLLDSPPPKSPRYWHTCKQCPRTGPCKKGAGCSNRGGGAASQQCEHGARRRACRRGLCPARQLNAKAGYGYHTDDDIFAVLRRAPPPPFGIRAQGGRRVSWPMGMPSSGLALHHAMKREAKRTVGPKGRVHAPISLG